MTTCIRSYAAAVLITAAALFVPQKSQAIELVGRSWNFFEVYGSFAQPVGKVDGIGVIDFYNEFDRITDVGADKVYEPSFNLGLSFGRLVQRHLLYTLGFRWTSLDTKDTFFINPNVYYIFDPEKPNFDQYDAIFGVDYLFMDLPKDGISPYLGVSFAGGFTAQTLKGYESEYDANVALSINFGGEIKITQFRGSGTFVTLASRNSWDILASGDRAKHLTLGGALRFYIQP